MDENIKQKTNEWTQPPFDESTVNEIKKLVYEKNDTELIDRFYKRLEFGTGGLRGIIGAGTNRMNIYTVGMASQGLANYILEQGSPSAGVIIARDSRNMSLEFAKEAAAVLAGCGITVYFFEDITPTPLCSFAIRELKAAAGIVITASHNPPEYNGYKVYWNDGGQIVPPHDKNIIAHVERISDISSIRKLPFEKGLESGKIRVLKDELLAAYISLLKKHIGRNDKNKSGLKIVYSPLHGTGYRAVPEALSALGFTNVIAEPEQSKPNGSFPTVESPNPEESSAMAMGIALAEKTGAELVLATDPDADRMGVAFRDSSGRFVLLNGNQTGALLEYHILSKLAETNRLPKAPAVIKTIVTSELQRAIGESFGCQVVDVLTGFKWIADKIKSWETAGPDFIFGGEESYGYLTVPFVRDKDAVSACCFFADMADRLAKRGSSVGEFLDEIYLRFGCYAEGLLSLTSKGKEGAEKIAALMADFRANPPIGFDGEKLAKILDYKEGFEGLPASDVLQYKLEDGTLITVRPSGTEPKIKFYISVRQDCTAENLVQIKENLKNRINKIKQELSNRAGEL